MPNPQTTEHIYVLALDSGCEGHSAPIQACATLDEAKKVQKATEFGHGSSLVKIYKVPVWPNVRQEEYYNIGAEQ